MENITIKPSIKEIDNSQNLTFDEHVFKYISEYNPSIYILTPCYSGLCNSAYVTSLLKTKDLFNKYQIPLTVIFCNNDSLITRARNNLIAKAMNDPLATHFLFIDGDISWNEIDILKLMLANKPVIGGVYPLKRYHWNKLTTNSNNSNIVQSIIDNVNKTVLKDTNSDEDIIQSYLLNYNVSYLDTILNIHMNLAKVKHIANGFMMLQRDVITQMIVQNPQLRYMDDTGFLKVHENTTAYALFNCEVVDHHYLSEDWVFCERWSNMGGEIFIDVSINLNHIGNETYKGNYLLSFL